MAFEFVDAAGADACALGLASNTDGAPPPGKSSSSSSHAVCACVVLTTVNAGNGAGVVFKTAFCCVLFAPQCARRAAIPSRTPAVVVVVVVVVTFTWNPAGGAGSSEAGVAMDSVCVVAVELAALAAYRRGGVSMGGLTDVVVAAGEEDTENTADVRAGCVVQVLSAGGAMRCCESRNAGRDAAAADVLDTACAGHGRTSGSQCSGICAAQARMPSRELLPGQRELVSAAS